MPTLRFICNVNDPITGKAYTRDPRCIAQKAEQYLKKTGIADTAYFGPEAEFFIFDDVPLRPDDNSGFYFVDSRGGAWNTGRSPRSPTWATSRATRKGYFPVPPIDTFRTSAPRWCSAMEKVGIQIEVQHHEVATAGQAEIDMQLRHAGQDGRPGLLVTSTSSRTSPGKHGKTVTFMPKPLFGTTAPACTPTRACGRARTCFSPGRVRRAEQTGAVLHRRPSEARAGAARRLRPTTNSYKRLVPGYEAPVNLAYSPAQPFGGDPHPDVLAEPARPSASSSARPDPACNPYLAFAAMLMAGLDGIAEQDRSGRADGQEPLRAAAGGTDEGAAGARRALEVAGRLEKDHEFLLKGDVFTQDFLDTWIEYKRKKKSTPCACGRIPTSSRSTTIFDLHRGERPPLPRFPNRITRARHFRSGRRQSRLEPRQLFESPFAFQATLRDIGCPAGGSREAHPDGAAQDQAGFDRFQAPLASEDEAGRLVGSGPGRPAGHVDQRVQLAGAGIERDLKTHGTTSTR